MIDKETILIVDDTPDNLTLMRGLLKDSYRVLVAPNGLVALKIAGGDVKPDLILLDIMMPGMDGYAVCEELKKHPGTSDIPVVFLTARTETEDEARGFEVGAVDYIMKPISPPIVMARVKTHLLLKKSRDFLSDKAEYLESEVSRRTREVEVIQNATIIALGSLAETRDNETGDHIRRTQLTIGLLARTLRDQGCYVKELSDRFIEQLYRSAPLHDIGKVGIPDRILLKPGKLDPEEFEIMKTHAALGYTALKQAQRQLGSGQTFLSTAMEICLRHHEKWDGSGYPDGLKGPEIPLSARLMALADVYDALISPRVYKAAFSHESAVETILEGSGSHFDPAVVEAFRQVSNQFRNLLSEV